MPRFNLNPDYLAAAAMCISTEETSPYLKGVYCVPKPDPETGTGVLMVATDRYRIALIHDPDGAAEKPAILSMNWKSAALKPARNTNCRVIVDTDSGTAKMIQTGDDTETPLALDTAREVGGTFPDYARVFPKWDATGTVMEQGWSSAYLASFSAASGRMTGEKSNNLRIVQPESGGPAWVYTNTPAALFILMPVRMSFPERQPWWIG